MNLNLNISNADGNLFRKIRVIAYIVIFYPIKYFCLFAILFIIIYIYKCSYLFACKARKKITKGFFTILGPKDINLIIIKIPDFFSIFRGFIIIFIGIIYAAIALLYFLVGGLVTIPFNFVFSVSPS